MGHSCYVFANKFNEYSALVASIMWGTKGEGSSQVGRGFEGQYNGLTRTIKVGYPNPAMIDALSKLLNRRRELSERIAARAADGRGLKYRMRLRIRLGHKFNNEVKSLRLKFQGRTVWLRSRIKGKPLNHDNWVVFTATRFSTPEAAAKFGHALQTALSVACALRHVPVDIGAENSPTGQFSQFVKDRVEAATGNFLLDDVHGLDVYPDTATAFVLLFDANLTVAMPADSFFAYADEIGGRVDQLSLEAVVASYLLNAASMSNHPVAAATLSLSAVELLAQSEKRSPAQKRWIKAVRSDLQERTDLSTQDKADLLKAVEGMFNVGISDRVKRMMTQLDLADQHDRWDRVYKTRSELFHGVRRLTQAEIVNLGSDAGDLCRLIVRHYVISKIGPVTF